MAGGELVLKLLEIFRAPAEHPLAADLAALAADPLDPLFEPSTVTAVVAAAAALLAGRAAELPPLVPEELLVGLHPGETAVPVREEMCTAPETTFTFGARPRPSVMRRYMGVVARITGPNGAASERMFMCGKGGAHTAEDIQALSLLRNPMAHLRAVAQQVAEFAAADRHALVPPEWVGLQFLLEVRRARQRLRTHAPSK